MMDMEIGGETEVDLYKHICLLSTALSSVLIPKLPSKHAHIQLTPAAMPRAFTHPLHHYSNLGVLFPHTIKEKSIVHFPCIFPFNYVEFKAVNKFISEQRTDRQLTGLLTQFNSNSIQDETLLAWLHEIQYCRITLS